MKKIRDRFSGHARIYSAYRPRYPAALYKRILERTEKRQDYWDCATGNGQVASVLAAQFETVYATDISQRQLKQAPRLPNVAYQVMRAEETSFEANSFDLITVAQAIHWFDIGIFLKEASRVGRPGSTLAVWGYGLLRFGNVIDTIIDHFYREVVGPYWDRERIHIDAGYAGIPFQLRDPEDLSDFQIEQTMDLQALLGYLTSWSSVQNFIRAEGKNPVEDLEVVLKMQWKERTNHTVQFPIFGILGKINK